MDTIKGLKDKIEFDIKNSSNVFIVGHNSPDFDSIGSCIGLYVLATSLGKKAYIIVDDEESKIEPGVKRILDENKDKFNFIKKADISYLIKNNSLLITSDVNKSNMISVGDMLDYFKKIYIIDHHNENEYTINSNNKYITTEVSSASEIVARLLMQFKTKIPEDVATFLLAGINLDTHRFKENTTSRTHDVAEKLIDKGADISYVNSLFLEEFDSFCRISNLIINGTTIKKYSESLAPIQISFTLNRNNPQEIYLKEDFAKAADRMMKFMGIDASFALGFVDEGVVHISARGGKRVNVGKIMQEMGGGGNPQSAGGRIEEEDLLKVEEDLMNKIALGITEEEQEEMMEEPKVIKKIKVVRKV
jgi:c-di-AMP phosphodiesterase-like protein